MKINEILKEFTSGSVATVVGGLGQTLYRNPSIYDNVGTVTEPTKKKKKKKQYSNSK